MRISEMCVRHAFLPREAQAVWRQKGRDWNTAAV